MPKLLLTYKGIPAVLNHRLKNIDKITFITVCTTGKNDYERTDFSDLESAIDYRPEDATMKLTFVYIESVLNGIKYVIYQWISFTGNKLYIENSVSLRHQGCRFTVDFGFE